MTRSRRATKEQAARGIERTMIVAGVDYLNTRNLLSLLREMRGLYDAGNQQTTSDERRRSSENGQSDRPDSERQGHDTNGDEV